MSAPHGYKLYSVFLLECASDGVVHRDRHGNCQAMAPLCITIQSPDVKQVAKLAEAMAKTYKVGDTHYRVGWIEAGEFPNTRRYDCHGNKWSAINPWADYGYDMEIM